MVRDFQNSTDQPDEISLNIYLSSVSSRSSRKWPVNRGFIQMARNFLPFRSERKEKYLHIFRTDFRKITLPFDFKPKFSGVLGKM